MTITVPETTATEQREIDPRAAFIDGLLQIADFLTTHPEVELPYLGYPAVMPIYIVSGDQKAQLARIARAMGKAEKDVAEYSDGSSRMVVSRQFAGIKLVASADRSEVCERVVTGTAEVTVEVQDPELLAAVPKVKRTKVVETVEWRCHPLLAEAPAELVGSDR